jgi:hypothetical protein
MEGIDGLRVTKGKDSMAEYRGRWTTVRVELKQGIAWLIPRLPEKHDYGPYHTAVFD